MLQTKGRSSHPVWVVGEYATYNDIKYGKVYSGGSGHVLNEQLESAGFDLDKIHFRYVTDKRPPRGELNSWLCTKTQLDSRCFIPYEGAKTYGVDPVLHQDIQLLLQAITEHKPRVIFACGELALLALTQNRAITNWRGSMIEQDGVLIIPTFSPSKVMQNYEWSFFQKQDFVRGKKFLDNKLPPKPKENFEIRPNFAHVVDRLKLLFERADGLMEPPLELGVDIEGRGLITCLGIAWTREDAICIPFQSCTSSYTDQPGSYWRPDQELQIIQLLTKLLTHPNVQCHGQNFNYDRVHICRILGFNPRLGMDTMQAWHVCFPLLPKALHSISSFMLPWYVYWKDEGKGHNPTSPEDEDNYWVYNCKDCCRTLELVPLLKDLIIDMGQEEQYLEQRALNKPALRMMLRGIKQDVDLRNKSAMQLMSIIAEYEQWFIDITPALLGDHKLVKDKKAKPWYRSTKQQSILFYKILGLPVQKNRKTKQPTTEDAALQTLMIREPLFKPVFTKIVEYRSLGVFLTTFILAGLDWDKRFRCSYGIGMAETFRFTSSKDAFGLGGNLQNIPKGNELDE